MYSVSSSFSCFFFLLNCWFYKYCFLIMCSFCVKGGPCKLNVWDLPNYFFPRCLWHLSWEFLGSSLSRTSLECNFLSFISFLSSKIWRGPFIFSDKCTFCQPAKIKPSFMSDTGLYMILMTHASLQEYSCNIKEGQGQGQLIDVPLFSTNELTVDGRLCLPPCMILCAK